MSLRNLLYQVVRPVLGLAARNRFLIRRVFGIRVPRAVTVHFDPTTLLLRLALQQVVVPQDKLALEVGIGQGALLVLGLQKSTQLRVEGVDCSETRVRSSQKVAKYNQLAADFYVSDLFDQVPPDRQYDLIFFNPPYVPTRDGEQLGLTRHMRADSSRVWDGGDNGMQVLREFLLRVPAHLTSRGRVLFGVQPIFVPEENVQAMIDVSHLVLLNRITRRWIPSVVYVVGHASDRRTAR
jgi:release factor glutamine methyltransferase